MYIITNALGLILGVIALVCWIMVLIKMFQSGATGLAIASIVLVFCIGIGPLIAFVYGWMRARDWGITNLMTVWTICFVLGIVLNVGNLLMGGVVIPD